MRVSVFFIFLFVFHLANLSAVKAGAQNTVGIISQQEEKVFEGYNLVFPHTQSSVYLLDNCGRIVHQWTDADDFIPGNSVYLMENGNLVKCKRARTSAVNDPIWAGGAGETVEIRTWENELLHSFTLNDTLSRLHHDVAPLPNGNVLMIAWSLKTFEESVAAGRDPSSLSQDKLWQEVILEWNPSLDSIIWQWEVWDHLVQNYDNTKDNFAQPGNHPELIDLNYDEHAGHPDWLHFNAIDYNPVLDQIVVSVPYFNEFWVIDHSTTTEEAASHTGGSSGKGGDLLYRWGNPQAYSRGTETDKKLFFQHDTHWVNPNATTDDDDYGKIALFNNRLPDGSSTGNVISTLSEMDYTISQSTYLPTDFERTVLYPKDDIRAFSNSLSSAQFLPNGNALLIAGRWGFAYELTPENEIAWEYIVPLKAGEPVSQGDTLSISNNVTFRFKRFGLDYPAFEEKMLDTLGYLELNPTIGFCGLISSTNSFVEFPIDIYPNPASHQIFIDKGDTEIKQLSLYNLQGQLIKRFSLSANITTVNIEDLSPGMYILKGDNSFARKLVVY